MISSYSFALTAHVRRSNPENAKVIHFEQDAVSIRLRNRDEIVIPYHQLKGIELISTGKILPEFIYELGLNSFVKREDHIILKTDEQYFQLFLEVDSLYRRSDLIAVLKHFYELGIPVKEKTKTGRTLFLFEPADPDEIQQLAAQLKKNS